MFFPGDLLTVHQFWEPDFEGNVIREVLRWIYLQKLDSKAVKNQTEKLLNAAEQFLLPSLQKAVEMELLNLLNRETVFSIISKADRCNVGYDILNILTQFDYVLAESSERSLQELRSG